MQNETVIVLPTNHTIIYLLPLSSYLFYFPIKSILFSSFLHFRKLIRVKLLHRIQMIMTLARSSKGFEKTSVYDGSFVVIQCKYPFTINESYLWQWFSWNCPVLLNLYKAFTSAIQEIVLKTTIKETLL